MTQQGTLATAANPTFKLLLPRIFIWLALSLGLLLVGEEPARALTQNQAIDLCNDEKIPDRQIVGCSDLLNRKRISRSDKLVALGLRASAYSAKGDYNQAIQDYNEAIRLDPRDATVFYNRGFAYGQKSDYDQAIQDLSEAVRLRPNYVDAFKYRGDVYQTKGDVDRALLDFQQVIRLDPKHAIAFFNLGLLYSTKGDYERSIQGFSDAIHVNPNYPNFFLNRGIVYYYYKKDLDRAISDFDKTIALNPNDSSVFRLRGSARLRKEDRQGAVADLNKAIELDPKDASALNQRAWAYYEMGDLDRALLDADRAIALKADFANALDTRGAIFVAKRDFEQAIADLDKAIVIDGKNSTFYLRRADAYAGKDDKVKALADYGTAVGLLPADDPRKAEAQAKIAALNAGGAMSPQSSISVANSQARLDNIAVAAGTRRVALVIGNSAYRAVSALPNPGKDAELVGDALRKAGVGDVTVLHDLDRAGLVSALKAFALKADGADWAVVYYAGHGIEVDGRNYLVPVDATLQSDRDVPDEAVALDRVQTAIGGAHELGLVVLDACRNNPFIKQMKRIVATRSIDRGLARVEPTGATLVVYAAKEGTLAKDGDGANSPFAASFAKRIVEPGVEINLALRFMRQDVLTATGGEQEPFVYGSLPPTAFYFVPTQAASTIK